MVVHGGGGVLNTFSFCPVHLDVIQQECHYLSEKWLCAGRVFGFVDGFTSVFVEMPASLLAWSPCANSPVETLRDVFFFHEFIKCGHLRCCTLVYVN